MSEDARRGLGRALLVGLFVVGINYLWSSAPTWASSIQEKYQDLQIFTKVLNLIQQYYVEQVDAKKLIQGGIKGMMRELDPHTNFLPPEIYKTFENETRGEFGGIGVEITTKKGILTVISPIEDTPAWKAGVKAGDIIVSIDGTSTKGLSLAEAAQLMRGKLGSKVRLGILRGGQDEPITIEVARDVVKIRSVKYTNLQDGYGYFRITSFIENTGVELEKAIKRLKSDNRDSISGMILDLRGNPGGLLEQAVRVSDLFLEEGVIVATHGRHEKTVTRAQKEGTLSGFPIVVLIDEASASASEIVAGALQDNKRALIMGKRSFGKGSVQSVVQLGDGSGVKLTVARYYTASGRSIQAEGIHPDVEIENLKPEVLASARVEQRIRREQDIDGHLENDGAPARSREKRETDQRRESLAMFFWSTEESDKKQETPRDKLLAGDFQVLQAYNYLKAWKFLK